MQQKRWFLGIDGGQSATVALVADETGSVVGVGHAGPCNHVSSEESRDRYRSAINGAVTEALRSAGLAGAAFATACLGLSGGPEDKEALTREIVLAGNLLITNDAEIALSGAMEGDPGVIVIAGTGSIAYGRGKDGKTARAGGWGYLFGDEGGAFDIVRQGLRAALRYEEGWGPVTQLREVLIEATGARDANELMHHLYSADFPRARVAALAPLIEHSARSGDEVAWSIVRDAAQSLAVIAAAVRRQLFDDSEIARVSYVGGVFQSVMILEQFKTLVEMDQQTFVTPPRFGPATGALIAAFRASGLNLSPSGAETDL